jgi:hypothetical protein
MFRIDVSGEDGKPTVKIAGRLEARCAEEVKRHVLRCRDPHWLVVDLSEVIFVDSSGEELLSWLAQIGAQAIAQGFYCLDICERLHLPTLKASASRRRL